MVNKDFYRSIENHFRFPVTSYLHLIDFLDLQGGTNYLFRLIINLYCVKLASRHGIWKCAHVYNFSKISKRRLKNV